MKAEQRIERFCEVVKENTRVKIEVRLAERMCGYDIVRLSDCSHKKVCGHTHCDFIDSEEEKSIDQLILEHYRQQDIRARIRETMKDSNQ